MSKATHTLFLALFAVAAGCNYTVTPSGTPHNESIAGSEATGGEASGSGGDVGSGGNPGAGGDVGGSSGNGGSAGNGGNPSSGGMASSGGSSSAGGNQGSAGRPGSGGTSSSGGNNGAGGTSSAGGATSKADAGSSSVSFSTQILPMLNQNCSSCHGASGASAGVSLNNYTNVKANATRANSDIQAGIMPLTGPLSAANKQLFQAWVTEGMPNN